jgi:large subunit ribosomal protein L10
MATQKKIDTVNNLTDKIARAKSMVFADYTGIKHKQLEELRKTLKPLDAEFVIIKNKLMERALKDTAKDVKEELKASTATLFAYADEVTPLKALLKYFKNVQLGRTKGGLLGISHISQTDVSRLAQLPSREVLLAKLVGQLNAPIQGLHYALSWNINRLVWVLNGVKNKAGQ